LLPRDAVSYNEITGSTVALHLVLVVTANRTVNVLGVEIKNIHNFDETWMNVPLWYKKIKSGRKTANSNTKKPLKFYHC